MIKLAAISPRTNAFMSETRGSTPEESVFSKMFSNMAYGVLENKMPKLLDSVITFKILESEINSGEAFGVFIVQTGPTTVYIPIHLSNNKVTPPDLFYSKDLDSFLPLTDAWLKELEKISQPEMGGPIEAPETLSSNLDIRGLTIPPFTGRTSYASFNKTNLFEVLDKGGNVVKEAFANLLRDNRDCLGAAVKHHGEELFEHLRLESEKVAVAPKDWWVLTPDSPKSDYDDAFGPSAKLAYQAALEEGVVVCDLRKTAAVPITTEYPIKPQEPASSGAYKIVDTDGKVHSVAIFRNPVSVDSPSFMIPTLKGRQKPTKEFLVVFPDGKYTLTDSLVALDTEEELPKGVLKKALETGEGSLKAGKQVLVRGGGSAAATRPFTLKGLSNDSDDVQRGSITDTGFTLVRSSKAPLKVPHIPEDSKTVFIPTSYVSVKVTTEFPREKLVRDASTLLSMIRSGVAKLAHASIKVKNMGSGDWAVDGIRVGTKEDALKKMASLNIRIDASKSFLSTILSGQSISAHLVAPSELTKLGSIFGKEAQPPMEGGGGMPMDPAAMGGGVPQDPSMMEPPEINPEFMQSAAALDDQGVFDTAAVASVLQSPTLSEQVVGYLPTLEKALDGLGRVILAISLKESELREEIGQSDYVSLEQNIKRVFRGLGDIIIKLNQHTLSLEEKPEAMGAWGA